MAKNALLSGPDAPKRRRKCMMSDTEVITILICFHFNLFRNFKHYLPWMRMSTVETPFPKRFSYSRFVEVMPRCFIALSMFLKFVCFR